MTRVLGLDIGGSRSRARLATGPRPADVLVESEAPSASLSAAGLEPASQAVQILLTGVGLGPSPPAPGSAELVDAICVGSAGSGTPDAVQWLLGRLSPLTRGGRGSISIVNDSLLALPAAGLDEGIAIICGTGSTAVGVRRDRRERAGGWGYMLGDEGSGYWIVREAVRELSRRYDAHERPGAPGSGQVGAVAEDAAGRKHLRTHVVSLFRQPEGRIRSRTSSTVIAPSRRPSSSHTATLTRL